MNISEENTFNLSPGEIERYSRHLTLPEIGMSGQSKLKESSLLCVGAGGLASPLLLYLAAAGVGEIGIIDFDLVEESNLQRQIIHSINSLGDNKANSAKSRILDINPYCKVTIFNEPLTRYNALEIVNKYQIIADCTDNFPSRYLINDACVILGKPNIYGSIQGFQGQASVFNLQENSPNYRDLVPVPPPKDLVPSCAEGGVLGVLPGIIGVIQATEAIKIITRIGESLDGRILVFDALSMRFKELSLDHDSNSGKIQELIDYEEFCSNYAQHDETKDDSNKSTISIDLLKKLLAKNDSKITLIDVRETNEHEEFSIIGSLSIPLKLIEDGSAIGQIEELNNHSKIYLYCKSGRRSLLAMRTLLSHGIESFTVQGGIDGWKRS